MSIVTAKGLIKDYDHLRAVDNILFEIKKRGWFYLNVQGTKVKEERINRTVPFSTNFTLTSAFPILPYFSILSFFSFHSLNPA
jgi:hypothetical protein